MVVYVTLASMSRVRFPVSTNIIFSFVFLISTPLQTLLIAHTGKGILWLGFCNVLATLHLTYRTALLSSETPILPKTSIMANLAYYASNSKGKGYRLCSGHSTFDLKKCNEITQ